MFAGFVDSWGNVHRNVADKEKLHLVIINGTRLLGTAHVFLEAREALPGLKPLLGSFVMILALHMSIPGATLLPSRVRELHCQ